MFNYTSKSYRCKFITAAGQISSAIISFFRFQENIFKFLESSVVQQILKPVEIFQKSWQGG